MIEKSQAAININQPIHARIDKLSLLFVLVSVILGVAISLVVGKFGWVTLIIIPVVVLVVATTGNPNLGLVSLIILIFIQLQRVVTEFHDLPGPGKPMVLFLIIVVGIRTLVFNEWPDSWLKNSFILGIYFIFLSISAITASVLTPALQELVDVVQNLVIASIILFIVQRSPSLKNAIWAIIVAGIIMATISVFQNLTGTFNNNYWGFGGWEYSGYVGRPRLTGPYATPNPYAQILVLIFVLALDRMWNDRKPVLRLVAGFAAVVSALAMVYTDSRGGFADMIFTLFIFFIFNRPSLPSLMITLVIGIGLFQFLPANYTDRILTLTELNPFNQTDIGLQDESFRGRTSENLAAWRMFLDHPVFGVGLNNYAEHYQEYSREIGLDNRREARDPASLYLQLLADQGLIGTFIFLALIFFVFASLLRAYGIFKAAKMYDEMKISAALFAALAGYMFMSLYRNNAYTNVFWVLIAVCMSTMQVATTPIPNDFESEIVHGVAPLSLQEQSLDISKAAIHGTAWRYVAMFSGKFMVFVSTVVLARLLTKDDFGLVGYAVTIIALLESLSDLGVTAAVIYHPDDQELVSTGFWINQITGLLFFGLTWLCAPAIAVYFRDERVVDVTRVLSLTFPFQALGYMQETVLLKRLSFKRSFIPSFIKSLAKGLASIGFAFAGYGPWSLIWGQLIGTLISSITYWIVTPWRPSFVFKIKMAVSLLKYGIVFIVGEMLSLFLMYLDYLLVGRYLGSEKLGVYTLAFRMPDLLILEFARTLSNVLFPIYSQMRTKTGDMSRGFFLATRYISLLTIPMGLGLALVAEPFILTFFTDKWIDAIPVVRGIAIYATLLSVVHNTTSVYWAEGRPQISTWVGLTRLAMLLPALLWAVLVTQSIVVVSWVHAGMAFLSAILNFVIASRLIGLPLIDIGRALRPGVLAGALMTVAVMISMQITQPLFAPWLLLTVNVVVGGLAYVVSLWFLQRDIVLAVVLKLRSSIGWD